MPHANLGLNQGLMVKDLSFAYAKQVIANRGSLQNVCFDVPPGQILGVAGANGAGKSTLMQLLAGQLSPHSGVCCFNGQVLHQLPPRQLAQQRAWLSQSPTLMSGFTVWQVIQLGGYPFSVTHHTLHQTTQAVVKRFALDGLVAADVMTLSGGQQQRVQLARIALQLLLVTNAADHQQKLVLLDEPLTGLDLQYRQYFLQWLREQTTARKWSVVIILHELNRLLNVSDKLILLKNGQTVVHGAVSQLFAEVRESVGQNSLLSDVYDCPVQMAKIPSVGWVVTS